MKIVYSILILFLLSACRDTKSNVVQSKSKPSYIDSLEIEKLQQLENYGLARYNDSAKWRVYFYHCDLTWKAGKDYKKSPPVHLGFLKLKLTSVSLEDDKLSLFYHFLLNDSTDFRDTNKGWNPGGGVEFNVKDQVVNGYIRGHGNVIFNETGKGGYQIRYENPTHPDVIKFINQNKNELNTWFKNEAIRRNLLLN